MTLKNDAGPARNILRDQRRAWTEQQFQAEVVKLFRQHRWLVTHTLPARHRNGLWVTPTQGDVGEPDTRAVRKGRIVIAELKVYRPSGRTPDRPPVKYYPTKAERAYLDEYRTTAAEVYEWWPDDWSEIERVVS